MGFAKETIECVVSDAINKMLAKHFMGVARDVDSEVYSTVMSLGFDLAEVCVIAAHDWGHYKLMAVINHHGWDMKSPSDWWTEYADNEINTNPREFKLSDEVIASIEEHSDLYEAYDTIAFGSPIYCDGGEEVGIEAMNKIAQAIRVLERAGLAPD